jgi:hypothetical protein
MGMAVAHDTSSPMARARQARPRLLVPALLLMLVAGAGAGWHAYAEQGRRSLPLDLDGWGHRVKDLQEGESRLDLLTAAPSVWKGFLIPFIYGLAYCVAPVPEAPLVVNVLAFAGAAGLFFLGFCALGAGRLGAAAAVLLWLLYAPHHWIFGYYLAEPLLALLLSLAFVCAGQALKRENLRLVFLTGLLCGALLLARAPYLLGAALVAALCWYYFPRRRLAAVSLFSAGVVVVLMPWAVRNYVVLGEFIPFTTEGGLALFIGTYVPGDDAAIAGVRENAEFVALEKAQRDLGPVESDRYWKRLALEQVAEDPLGQLELCGKKALHFWVYLPPHSWAPAWKTGLAAGLALPLACIGAIGGRRRLLVQLATAWVIGLWALHTLVHAELRYNFPVLPITFLLAVTGVQVLWERAARSRKGAAAPLVQEPVRDHAPVAADVRP